MKRLAAITKRLFDEAGPDKDADTKMEDGSTMEWVAHSESDVAWLLQRIEELIETSRAVAKGLTARIDEARLHGNGGVPVFDGLAEMRVAIHKAVDTDDPPLASKLVSASLIEPLKRG